MLKISSFYFKIFVRMKPSKAFWPAKVRSVHHNYQSSCKKKLLKSMHYLSKKIVSEWLGIKNTACYSQKSFWLRVASTQEINSINTMLEIYEIYQRYFTQFIQSELRQNVLWRENWTVKFSGAKFCTSKCLYCENLRRTIILQITFTDKCNTGKLF